MSCLDVLWFLAIILVGVIVGLIVGLQYGLLYGLLGAGAGFLGAYGSVYFVAVLLEHRNKGPKEGRRRDGAR